MSDENPTREVLPLADSLSIEQIRRTVDGEDAQTLKQTGVGGGYDNCKPRRWSNNCTE